MDNSLCFSAGPLSSLNGLSLLCYLFTLWQASSVKMFFMLRWFGRVGFFFSFSAYQSNGLCYGFPFNLLGLLCFRKFQEVLSYDKGCIVTSNMSFMLLHVNLFLQNLEFPGNPLENHILLDTFLLLTANFTQEITHHLRFQQFHLELLQSRFGGGWDMKHPKRVQD